MFVYLKSAGRLFSSIQPELRPGILLVTCAVIAMVLANSVWSSAYFSFLNFKLAGLNLSHWINDGLMTVFFFYIGMEIKKEIVDGELKSPRKAALPILAALGGMVVPALIYFSLNPTGDEVRGWGIPMATDIAFALGVLSLFGSRIPVALKVFLLAIAIVDDLGAILVIAFFYTAEIKGAGLGVAVLALAFMALLRTIGMRSYLAYVAVGVVAWGGILFSGIHATIAGVLIGLLTPLSFPQEKGDKEKLYSPLDELAHMLHPWVSYFIMPVFALANAGVVLGEIYFSDLVSHPVHQGVALGLIMGKPLGIITFSLLAVRINLASLTQGLSWQGIISVGFLAGIGFTMSIFISSLALPPDLEIYSKTGILLGSLASMAMGSLFIVFSTKPGKKS